MLPDAAGTFAAWRRHQALVGQKTLFASKPCVAPIFCVIIPSIYQLMNKLL
jgi:hypothetical protein